MSFDVSLDVQSATASLAQLNTLLGRQGDSGSHSKGDPRPLSDSQWLTSVWRQFVSCDRASLEDTCLELLNSAVLSRVRLLQDAGLEPSVCLTIAQYFETAYVTFVTSQRLINRLAAAGVSLECVGYPVNENVV